jgi:hypothetical protein
MRVSALLVAIGMAACALATAAPPPTPAPPVAPDRAPPKLLKHVRLDSKDDLERLRSSNPHHYEIARKILEAANEICDARQAGPIPLKFEAQDVGCISSMWLTSNPPKRALSFTIDDTVYSALVEVRNLGSKLIPADPAWALPPSSQPRK